MPYAKSFLITGSYVAGTVDLTEQANPIDLDGFSHGTIHMGTNATNTVPPNAEIVAAYLYWETITETANLASASGVTFRGNEILLNDVLAVKKAAMPLTGQLASCWSSGTPLSMTQFRADVLRWLPIRVDAHDQPTPYRLVNDQDLTAHGFPLTEVKLPVRAGNQVPESAGASLVVVYRLPSLPLSKVVIYDGIHIQSSLTEVTTQSLQGFYKSATGGPGSALITQIIGSGQPNANERIQFDDGNPPANKVIATNPVMAGSASQRGWSTLTYDVSNRMNPGNNSKGGYGETATTTVDHTPGGGYDCLTWGAIIFKTNVADADGDGLPDGLEDAQSGLMDPDGTALPNLNAMGASSHDQRDLFVEFNALWAAAGTSYGGPNAPYPYATPTPPTLTDSTGHNHMPTPEMLKMVGDAYAAYGITAHFDVGPWGTNTGYHAPNANHDPQLLGVVQHVDWVDDYTSNIADSYLVPSAYARGGEIVKETACAPTGSNCQFSDFPGTIGWKLGLQMYRDQPVGDNGQEISLNLDDPNYFNWATGTHRRRFDHERFGLFHYLLYAHARGKPKSDQPCLINGVPGPYPNNGTTCNTGDPSVTGNPDFHVPLSASGISDLPGGNAIVSLGLWDDFVGRPFVRAATTLHELGHNLNLWHGGLPATWGDNPLPQYGTPTTTVIEPNCKPNYISSMSYLFQVHGLFDTFDQIHLDYSGTQYTPALNENGTLTDGALFPTPPYRPAWYAPSTSQLAAQLGVPRATRYCSGSKFPYEPPSDPRNPFMARVYTALTNDSINWNGDPAAGSTTGQDVNFDSVLSSSLSGFNDWANIRLDQISAGRHARRFEEEPISKDGSGDWIDVGGGNGNYGSGDWIDVGGGDWIDVGGGVLYNQTSGDWVDVGGGDWVDVGGGDWVDVGGGDWVDVGGGDWVDVGGGDWVDVGGGNQRQDLNFDAARGLGSSVPYALTACIVGNTGCTAANQQTPQYHRNEVQWTPPTVGHISQYDIQRKRGSATSTSSYATIGSSSSASFIDFEELPDGVAFTYRVRANYDDDGPTPSPWSQPVTISAVNSAPTGNAESYTTFQNTTLNVAAPGVLGNDTDPDSPTAYTGRVAVLVTNVSQGTLVLNSNGSFTYTPGSGYVGSDSFTYKVDDGVWSADPTVPLSSFSGNVTVSITVKKKNK